MGLKRKYFHLFEKQWKLAKNLRNYFMFVILISGMFSGFLFPSFLQAQTGKWTTFTNKSSIREMVYDQGKIWCATNGGVVAFHPDGSEALTLTNTDGLSFNNVTHLSVDHKGNLWFGLANGIIDLYNPQDGSLQVIDDFVRNEIRSIVPSGDSIFVGLNIGVSLFLLDRMEVKETYKNLGTLPIEMPVNAVAVDFPYIWVATNQGIARADLRQTNLKAPQSWENFGLKEGLPSLKVESIFAGNGVILAGTDLGVVRFENNRWLPVNRGLGQKGIAGFFSEKRNVFALTSTVVYKLEHQYWEWRPIVQGFQKGRSLLIQPESTFWVGTDGSGIFWFDSTTTSNRVLVPNGPGGNKFKGMAIDQNNNLWVGSANIYGWGFAKFDGTTWTVFNRAKNGLPSDNVECVAVDHANNVWFGTWGGGVYVVRPDGSMGFYNAKTGHFSGIPQDLSYAVITDIQVDKAGIVWFLNYYPYNRKVLVGVTPDSQWVYFTAEELGLESDKVNTLLIDHRGWKWIGTENNGIAVFNDNETPLDKSDDQTMGTLTMADGLESNAIAAIGEDDFGAIWIGTKEGVAFYLDGQVQPRYGLISTDITCMDIDPRNNKWIGTSAGMSVLDPDGYRWTHYTTDNSLIASNSVQSVAFNKKTGEVFIGTTRGLSRFQTPYIEPRNDLSGLRAYPNPFLLNGENDRVVIDGLAQESSVTIYSESGRKIRFFPREQVLGARVSWDGRTKEGEPVASGIYLIVAATQDGASKVTKLAVIHK